MSEGWCLRSEKECEVDRQKLHDANNEIQNLSLKVAAHEKQMERMRRMLANELCENDELGSEFAYVSILKDELQLKGSEVEEIQEDLKIKMDLIQSYRSNLINCQNRIHSDICGHSCVSECLDAVEALNQEERDRCQIIKPIG
jgi:hypothetical protein